MARSIVLREHCNSRPAWPLSMRRQFFLMNEGVHLARKGFAESMAWQKSFSPVAELMKSPIEDFDCKFYICASCVKPMGLRARSLLKTPK
jgi:predicted peroxiredoxin